MRSGDPHIARSGQSWIRSNKPFSSPVQRDMTATTIAGAAGNSSEVGKIDAFSKTTKDFNWGNHVGEDTV